MTTSLILFCSLAFACAFKPHLLGSRLKGGLGTSLSYDIEYFSQDIDHFGFSSTLGTYQQRYIISDEYWGVNRRGSCPGPIFFYTGNEGDIFMFWNNTGFVTDFLAEKFGALVVFAEHRYYGDSLPFGTESFELQNIGYLSAEQALADYAILIGNLKEKLQAEDCPVISFGGSYGGMLSAWFRLKYPQVVDGAIAASAPILQFYGTGVSQWTFNEIVTNDFICSGSMRDAFEEIIMLGESTQGFETLNQVFQLCEQGRITNQEGVQALIGWIESGLTDLAMIDYPYPTNFLEPVPAWPVSYACDVMETSIDKGASLVEAFAAAIGVYFNYTGSVSCNNINSTAGADLGVFAWGYQSCTEMVMPISSNGSSDMFPPQLFNMTQQDEYCGATWGVTPRPNWVITNFGGELLSNGLPNIVGSNIVFSNGLLDPWHGGGVLENLTDSLVAVIIEDGAHHLDLRAPNPADPQSVIDARDFEIAFIDQWIEEKYRSNSP